MKLVSPKTLMASLLGIAFIIIKIKFFDGILDLIWIALFGYLIIKGVKISFSKEAYDEDVKEAYQGKALYTALFGRFAFIVTDIPFLIILFSGLLVAVCPITTILRVVICVLLVLAMGYAIWISCYISKHKQIRIDNGEWGTAVLTAEEERAWKYYARCHNIVMGIILVLGILYVSFGNPKIYINNNKIKDVLTEINCDSVTLEEIIPFEWSSVYTFDPYTSLERIEHIVGSKSPVLKETVNEGMTHFVFKNNGRVVASVCAYPSSVGYSLNFSGGKNTYYEYMDGGYSHIEYGEQVEFNVTKNDGIIRLYAYIEE